MIQGKSTTNKIVGNLLSKCVNDVVWIGKTSRLLVNGSRKATLLPDLSKCSKSSKRKFFVTDFLSNDTLMKADR